MILGPLLCAFLFQQSIVAGDNDASSQSLATEQAVTAAYKRMEQADRKGDGELWFALRDRKTLDTMDAALKDSIRKGGHARPSVQYEPLTVRVRADRAIVLGKVTDPQAATTQYQTVLFVVEAGEWKVSREQWSDSPFDPFVLFGFMPPEGGAFTRAGMPWKRVPYASANMQILSKKDLIWKMQAAYDESFLYIRYEWVTQVPAPGSRVRPDVADAGKTGGPPPPPPMTIKLGGPATSQEAGRRELSVAVSDVVSTRAAFASGANSTANTFFVDYLLSVKNTAGDDVFQYSIGNDSTGHLLSVQDRFVDVRIPLGGLGLSDLDKIEIHLEESDAVMRTLPYTVQRFVGK